MAGPSHHHHHQNIKITLKIAYVSGSQRGLREAQVVREGILGGL